MPSPPLKLSKDSSKSIESHVTHSRAHSREIILLQFYYAERDKNECAILFDTPDREPISYFTWESHFKPTNRNSNDSLEQELSPRQKMDSIDRISENDSLDSCLCAYSHFRAIRIHLSMISYETLECYITLSQYYKAEKRQEISIFHVNHVNNLRNGSSESQRNRPK